MLEKKSATISSPERTRKSWNRSPPFPQVARKSHFPGTEQAPGNGILSVLPLNESYLTFHTVNNITDDVKAF